MKRSRHERFLLTCLIACCSSLPAPAQQNGQFAEGKAVISPGVSQVQAKGAWTVTYTVGPSGIATGGAVQIGFSTFPTTVFATPQVDDPKKPNFVTASASRPGVKLDLSVRRQLRGGWQQIEVVDIKLVEGQLQEGDTVRVIYGDTNGGSPGGYLRRGNELAQVEIPVFVDAKGDGKCLPIEFENQPKLDIIGGDAQGLEVFAPSTAVAGESFEISVVAKDQGRNVAMDFGTPVTVDCPDEPGFAPITVTFPEKGPAAKRTPVRLTTDGVRRFRALPPPSQGAPRRVDAKEFLHATPSPVDPPGFLPKLTAVELGATTVRPGDSFRLVTHWRNEGTAAAATDYRISVHLAPPSDQGRAAANWDFAPSVATSQWKPNEPIEAERVCGVPAQLPEGEYSIRMGLYENIGPGKWRNLGAYLVCCLTVSRSAPPIRYVEPGESNPVLVGRTASEHRLYWGDTHVHTEHSGDGSGSVHEMYDYARDVARLDFAACADHVGPQFPEWRWRYIQTAAAEHNRPNDFVSILGYEWSNQMHGDKNVYFLDDYEKVYVPESGEAEDFYDMLRGKRLFVIPHHPAYPVGLRGMDWTRVDMDLIRLVEMCSAHGTAEYLGNPDEYGRNKNMGPSLPGGFAQDALKRGLRVGMISSSDDHSAHAGRVGFLAAVYAPKLTRRDLFEAFRARRCYGTSGARILVDFQVDGNPMGTEIESAGPTIQGTVVGTAPIEGVSLVKNGAVVYSTQGKDREARFRFVDSKFTEPLAWYYIRVRQEDGQRAWTSPIWVRSTKPFPDPAVASVTVAPEKPKAGQAAKVRVSVANRGKEKAPAGRIVVAAGGPKWSVVPRERQPVGGGIGGLMVKRGFQVWRWPADERSVNVFMRWGGGKEDARFSGEVTIHGAEEYLFTPFHSEEGDTYKDEGGGRITWDTVGESQTGDGLNLWVRMKPGSEAWVEIDVKCDGERRPQEVFSRTGKVTALPLRIPLTCVDSSVEERPLAVPALGAGETKTVEFDWTFARPGPVALRASIAADEKLEQMDGNNDSVLVDVAVE